MQEVDRHIGRIFGDTYRIERRIEKGGSGAVYEASHQRLSRRFAVKILSEHLASHAEALARFRREADIASSLGHPHIVDIIDFNRESDGTPYIVMELLVGEDLETRIHRSSGLTLPEVASIFRQVAETLHVVHSRGIIHRDLKPRNILLCQRGQRDDFVKIVDFGISKVMGATTRLTRTEHLIGTPNYMSPEQAQEKASEADPRTDVYAMGVILFEMLTGHLPFAAKNLPSLLFQIVHSVAPSVREFRHDLPDGLDGLIERALAKEPESRYPSILDFWDETARAIGYPDEFGDLVDHTEDRQMTWASTSAVDGTMATMPTTAMYDDLGERTAPRLAVDQSIRSSVETDSIEIFGSTSIEEADQGAGTPLIADDVPSFSAVESTPIVAVRGVESSRRNRTALLAAGIGAIVVLAGSIALWPQKKQKEQTALRPPTWSKREAERKKKLVRRPTSVAQASVSSQKAQQPKQRGLVRTKKSKAKKRHDQNRSEKRKISRVKKQRQRRRIARVVRPRVRKRASVPRQKAQLATLQVSALRDGAPIPADIYVDGQPVGQTPLYRPGVPSGDLVIEARWKGRSKTRHVRVPSGGRRSIVLRF